MGDDELLAEQIAYYDASAPEYLDGALDVPAAREVVDAVTAFAPTGDVLELACGPGTWTPLLARTARSVTAVDAAPAMLALARGRTRGRSVRFVQADLFAWRPDRRYDAVFFGFWLSHVPLARFAAFWATVADALVPGGRVFFVDDGDRDPDELVEGPESATVRRRLRDGSTHRLLKVPHTPDGLARRLRALGWDVTVTASSGIFFWGEGTRTGSSGA